MSNVLEQLVKLLDLRPIETNVFVGHSEDLGFKSLFGGQVLGQALMAAIKTVEPEKSVHSLHGYFLRPGKSDECIYYEVDLIRSGKSFSTRRVVAKQGGLAIFSMSASFHLHETGFEHQNPMPQVTGPEGLTSELDQIRLVKDKLPLALQQKLTTERPIEIRTVDPINYLAPQAQPPHKMSWMRTISRLDDSAALHAAMLAYASDFGLATTSLQPHGVTFFDPTLQLASLDHSMWFHRPFRMDEWLLYVRDSPSAVGGRGLNRGQFFTRSGILVASVTQEGLMRSVAPKQPRDPMNGLIN